MLLPFEMAQCALFLCVMYFFVGFYVSICGLQVCCHLSASHD